VVSVYEFTDYRAYLKARFTEQKRQQPQFSYQVFSRLAGAKSASFLTLVIDGQRNLAADGIRMIAKGFRLEEAELHHFECLVHFNQAKSHEEKDRWFRALARNQKFLSAKPLSSAHYNLFSHWYYLAILELVRLPANGAPKRAGWLQQRLVPAVSLKEIKQAVVDLKASGLIGDDPESGLFRIDAMLATDDEIRSLAVVNLHAQMSQLAARAVQEISALEREFSSLTILASENGFRRAKEEIQKFRKTLHSILEQDDGGPKAFVGQLNLQLFKLSTSESES